MKLFPCFVLMPCIVLFVAVQPGFPEPFVAETAPRENPCQVVVKYFTAVQAGDLAGVKSHWMNGQDELTQNEVDRDRGMLGNQKLTIHVAFSTLTRHRAIVVSGPLVMTPPKESGAERETRRFVLDLDDTLGHWLIRDTDFQTDEKAAETVVAFRRDFSDSLEVSIPKAMEPAPTNSASSSSRMNPREAAETIFKALMNGPLQDISTALGDSATQADIDQFRNALGKQKLTVATTLISETQHLALVVSEPFRITLTGKTPPPLGRYEVHLAATYESWIIRDINFVSPDQAENALAEFRKLHADTREIPAPEANSATAAKSKQKLIIFHLKYADAKSTASILNELFDEFSIVVDERTNSLIVRNPTGVELDELTAVLELLDEPAKQKPQPASRNSALEGPMPGSVTGPVQGGSTVSVDFRAIYEALEAGVDEEYVAEIRSTAEAAETNSIRTAEQIRNQLKETKDPAQQEELQLQLRSLVVTAFTERQSLQKSELVLLRNRLKRIEAQIQAREALRERIIDHRVDELLDPSLQWNIPQVRGDGLTGGTSKPSSLGGPAGLQQTVSPQALIQAGGGNPAAIAEKTTDVQVRFRSPTSVKIVWSAHENQKSLVVPTRMNLKTGTQHGFILSDISGREGRQIAGSIQVFASEQSAAFVKHNSVPMEFSEEDFEQVAAGHLVTKAIFLPDPEFQELATAGVETLVSTRTDPGVDAVTEAGKRGTILAILRLGNRAQTATLIGPNPVDAKILLSRQRLAELDSGTAASSDPQSAVVWIEALIEHASVNGTRDFTATYMNGTVISPQGHIAACAGPGSTEEEVRKAVLKLTVNVSDGTSHQGKLLAYDTQSGAAVIKIEAAGLNYLKICDDPIAQGRRLDVFALVQGNTPSPVKTPVYVVDSRFKVGDHDGFFAVAEANQTSLKAEFMGAPIVTTSGQLQGVLAENEAILYGPAIQPEDPKPRRAVAIPANVIRRLLNRIAEPQPDTVAPEKPADPVE